MNIVKDDRTGLFIVNGRFWTVQRGDIQSRGRDIVTDSHGNPRLEWPGRSVFGSLKEAEEVAKKLCDQYGDKYPFVVMQAVSAFAASRPPIVKRKL